MTDTSPKTTVESSSESIVPKDKVPAGHPPVSGNKSQCPFMAAKELRSKASKSRSDWPLKLSIFMVALSAIIGGIQYTRPDADWKQLFAFMPKDILPFKSSSNGSVGKEPGVFVNSPDVLPPNPVSFTVHFNGDGLSTGMKFNSSNFSSLDDIIERTCENFLTEDIDAIIKKEQCLPSNGARLYSHEGVRIYSFLDIKPYSRTYIVPQGVLFVYPVGEVGSVIYPGTVEEVVPGKPIKLTQLSMSPRVFNVENFMTSEEMEKIISHNEHLVKPSQVGFSGWSDPTRTSQTAWDSTSWAAKAVHKRSFDLAAMSFDLEMADSVQVLRYGNNEWYKPHCDWFDGKGYENYDPTVNNGTNRFATVFLYLTEVDKGGETVFPLSTTHEGYNGERLVHKGTEKTAGYISDKDAKWVCNESSTALRTTPKAGSAVLFYSQGPRGELDKYSLHGGCPVIEGTKWSANVWLWNRHKPKKGDASPEDKKRAEEAKSGKQVENNGIQVVMMNTFDKVIDVYWDDGSVEMVYQMQIEAGEGSPMTTYQGHQFFAFEAGTREKLGVYRADVGHNNEDISFS